MAGAIPRCSVRHLQRLFGSCSISAPVRSVKTSSCNGTKEIVIPNRIPRSSTDILEALASTVGRDSSGPHYKYHDDPYLTPASNVAKRSFSLSKESGRKAARWIRDKHSYLFTHRPEDPFIEAFYPKISFNDESDVSEDTLRELMQKCMVSDAIQVYQICKTKGVTLSDSVLQELLEFLGYYNCEDALDEDWVEERWYRQGIMSRDRIKNTWKDHGLAEELFKSLSHQGSPAYCALIRGMTRYYQVDRAWQLYQETLEKGVPLDTETYNSLIRVASFMREGSDLRWKLVKEILTAMAEAGVKPNLGTLNSTLESLSQIASWRQTKNLSLQAMAEFNRLGIQASLASYYYLLIIHCRERGPISHILVDIMNHIADKEFSIQDPKDTFFFVTAMDICRNHLHSKELARRVDDLLHTGNNYKLIGDSYKESIYYRHYFALSCNADTVDQFMELYNELVPHIYTPEPGVMEELLKALKVHEALEYLPQLWSDMIVFDHTSREKLLMAVLSAMTCHQPSEDNATLTQQLATIAWDLWTRVQQMEEDRRNKITWSGLMIGDLLTTLVRCGEYNKGVEVMQKISADPHIVLGSATVDSLQTLLDAAIKNNEANTGVLVVVYAVDAGHQEAADMAKKLGSSLTLSAEHRAKLTSVLGIDIIVDLKEKEIFES
ncbi:LOW QUALITY PROTEIN: protein PTCD3 homolog, mitochondrial-like [Penaeus monodon]|uniref:LOW QUALITY PROTEIN: protein PTCD3 homolog, mitochondrial-like n=1 Tax=Penaeus monodon TaxID=6687 RepID=UPI0018A7D497|nr:LOW QUALITY PROTEIN: protein PTCD3 homolog, mitochondrial-like [Penaeus monodon]